MNLNATQTFHVGPTKGMYLGLFCAKPRSKINSIMTVNDFRHRQSRNIIYFNFYESITNHLVKYLVEDFSTRISVVFFRTVVKISSYYYN